MLIQDARFERKPYFTIGDIIDDPFAGGISAFGAITDNYFIPLMGGVKADSGNNHISVSVLAVNSLGIVECWQMSFSCSQGLQHTAGLMMSPKAELEQLSERKLVTAVENMLNDERMSRRFRNGERSSKPCCLLCR